MEKIDTRPFKFEEFSSSQELKSFLEKNFPVGSSSEELINMLEVSGALCEVFIKEQSQLTLPTGSDYSTQCRYEAKWLSLHPLSCYKVIVFSNINKKITGFFAEKTTGLII
jgi:hypothetical protein